VTTYHAEVHGSHVSFELASGTAPDVAAICRLRSATGATVDVYRDDGLASTVRVDVLYLRPSGGVQRTSEGRMLPADLEWHEAIAGRLT
jgi:hypothetical protein